MVLALFTYIKAFTFTNTMQFDHICRDCLLYTVFTLFISSVFAIIIKKNCCIVPPVNNAAVNIGVHASLGIKVFFQKNAQD